MMNDYDFDCENIMNKRENENKRRKKKQWKNIDEKLIRM